MLAINSFSYVDNEPSSINRGELRLISTYKL